MTFSALAVFFARINWRETVFRPRFIVLWLCTGIVACFCSLFAAFVLSQFSSPRRVLAGVQMGMVDFSGLSQENALDLIRTLEHSIEYDLVTLRVDGTDLLIDPSDFSSGLDTAKAVEMVTDAGQEGMLWGRFLSWMRGKFGKKIQLDWPVAIDESKMRTVLAGVDFPGKRSPIEPVVRFQGIEADVSYGVDGLSLPLEETGKKVVGVLVRFDERLVQATPVAVRAVISDGEADRVAAFALAVTARSLTVEVDEATVSLNKAEQLSLFQVAREGKNFHLSVDPDAVFNLIDAKFDTVGIPARNAYFDFTGGVVRILPGTVGVGCCTIDTVERMESVMLDSSPGSRRRVRLDPEFIAPAVSETDLVDLQVTKQLSSFTTTYRPGESRVRNIHKIADMLSGTVVRPGESFSVNQAVGERTAASGWVSAGVIENGSFKQSPGGGISQFATTLYNAVYNAGLEINTHTPHSVYISRYPYGREATLSYPEPDLVFTNDTPGGIVVWAVHTYSSLTVAIYGHDDGRRVERRPPEMEKVGVCERVSTTRVIHRPDGRRDADSYRWTYRPEGSMGWEMCRK